MEFNYSKKNSDIEIVKEIEFFKDEKKSFRAQVLSIKGEPYSQVQKCKFSPQANLYLPSKNTVCLPFPVWEKFVKEVVPQLHPATQLQVSTVCNQTSSTLTTPTAPSKPKGKPLPLLKLSTTTAQPVANGNLN